MLLCCSAPPEPFGASDVVSQAAKNHRQLVAHPLLSLPAGWPRLTRRLPCTARVLLQVVTSDFHMPRTASLFCHMYRLAGQDMYGDPDRYGGRAVPG